MSPPTFVHPHAIRSLWPSWIPRTSGSETPATSIPGAERWISNHTDGVWAMMCGSFAKSGLPVTDRSPATTQLLDPCIDAGSGAVRRISSAASRPPPPSWTPALVPAVTTAGWACTSGNSACIASNPRRSAISHRRSSLSQLFDSV